MGGPTINEAYFISLFAEAILFGKMIALIVIMYCMSTAHTALGLRINLIALTKQHGLNSGNSILSTRGTSLMWIEECLEMVNCVIGDAVVCWRTWVLYGRKRRVLIFPVVCIVGGIVSAAGLAVSLAESGSGDQLFTSRTRLWFVLFGGLTFIANMYSVVLLCWKARSLRSHIGLLGKSPCRSALVIIVESGAVYCLSWVIVTALFLLESNGVYAMVSMMNHLTGMYPTAIIILVCLKITFHDDVTRHETLETLRFDTGSRRFIGQ
ncbi:uncharacterized protein BXZ73DRAFT_46061 [Epithele typhae]|uniref:uncharacterized protein n=1 Tax=Epithele typhae TaxID=378194 RepID=UPI0020085FE2|nr:uncharacterized protein BXZ73DRAFT_46061 [Epithele typhae]KAH9933968.1 hypothetical protein BXZ73DRAFT_46061 [Epithele typhae]